MRVLLGKCRNMLSHRVFITRPVAVCVCLWSIVSSQALFAHGNVVAEEDACVLQIGFYTAHFSAYQPQAHQHYEFCEDLPTVAETIFVIDYLHDSMREVAVDMRILKDSQKLGRFARAEHLTEMDFDLDTVYYHPPVAQSDAVFVGLHSFAESGDYIGVVTAANPSGDKVYTAVFPFRVGAPQWLWYLPIAVVLLLLTGICFWVVRRQWRPAATGSVAVLLAASISSLAAQPANAEDFQLQPSQDGRFFIGYRSTQAPAPLNQLHSWLVRIESTDHSPITNAEVSVSGGMPAHQHGLPTAPKITSNLGDGSYLLEGMKFHMPGHWQIELRVTAPGASDTLIIDLYL